MVLLLGEKHQSQEQSPLQHPKLLKAGLAFQLWHESLSIF